MLYLINENSHNASILRRKNFFYGISFIGWLFVISGAIIGYIKEKEVHDSCLDNNLTHLTTGTVVNIINSTNSYEIVYKYKEDVQINIFKNCSILVDKDVILPIIGFRKQLWFSKNGKCSYLRSFDNDCSRLLVFVSLYICFIVLFIILNIQCYKAINQLMNVSLTGTINSSVT